MPVDCGTPCHVDLESEQDRAKLAKHELYLSEYLGRLVILDEVHCAPRLFPVLRGLIDHARRAGKRECLYRPLLEALLLLQQLFPLAVDVGLDAGEQLF